MFAPTTPKQKPDTSSPRLSGSAGGTKGGPREGWEEAFRAAGSSAHDELFLDAPANQFDREEWWWLLTSASNKLGA